MKWSLLPVLGSLLYFASVATAPAELVENLPLDMVVTDRTQLVDRKKQGSIKNESFQNTYTIELNNRSTDKPIEQIKICIITYFSQHQVKRRKGTLRPGKSQVRDNISVAAGATVKVEFDPENFSHSDSLMEHEYRTSGGTTSYTYTPIADGLEYEGMALELYVGDKLVATRFSGSAEVRKTFEDTKFQGAAPNPNRNPYLPTR